LHELHISFNKATGKFEGIPEAVREAILGAGFTEEQVMENPSLVKDLLYTLDLEQVLSKAKRIEVSSPSDVQHFVSIRINPETGKLEGVPDVVKEALAKANLTEEQVMANPELAKDILYDIPLAAVVKGGKADPQISLPTSTAHHVSIKYNPETGKLEGIPTAVRNAIIAAGLTEEQVMENPDLAKDLLYKLNLQDVLAGVHAPDAGISAPKDVTHNIQICWNPTTSKFEGIPDAVREAIAKAGLTEEQVMKEPSLAKDILYQLNLEEVLKGAQVTHS